MHATNIGPFPAAVGAVAIDNTPAVIKYLQAFGRIPFESLSGRCTRGALLLMHAGLVQKLFSDATQPMPEINFPKGLFLLALGTTLLAIVNPTPVIRAVAAYFGSAPPAA